MFNASIYQNRSLYQKLVKSFRPNFNVKKHLIIADEYFNGDIKSYNLLARKHKCSTTRIKAMLQAFQQKILPVIERLQKEEQ